MNTCVYEYWPPNLIQYNKSGTCVYGSKAFTVYIEIPTILSVIVLHLYIVIRLPCSLKLSTHIYLIGHSVYVSQYKGLGCYGQVVSFASALSYIDRCDDIIGCIR